MAQRVFWARWLELDAKEWNPKNFCAITFVCIHAFQPRTVPLGLHTFNQMVLTPQKLLLYSMRQLRRLKMKLQRSYTKKDFELHWFSGTGAGGQYRNKHQNCCRITHIESGLTETGQRHREREANLKDAFTRLAAKIIALDELPEERRQAGSVVRTYHFERNEAIDHATGKRCSIAAAMDGIIEGFLSTPAREGKRPNSGRA